MDAKDWSDLLGIPPFTGIEGATYEPWKANETPSPALTPEMFEQAMEAIRNAKPTRMVELHAHSCPIWKTGDRLACRCSPGWVHVPVDS